MKIKEIRIEGGYQPKCVRPTIETEKGEIIMLGFTNVDDIDTVFAAQSVEYGETAPDTTQLKALLVLLPSMTDNIVIKDDTVFVQEEGKPKTFKQTITPLCASTGMEAICAIVHTPEVKQAYIDAQPPKQKTSKVTKPYSRIEMVDGVPVLKTGEEEVDEPVFEEIPVVDEAGNPAMDGSGNQITHRVPVME
jgi:hypothetical protein